MYFPYVHLAYVSKNWLRDCAHPAAPSKTQGWYSEAVLMRTDITKHKSSLYRLPLLVFSSHPQIPQHY